MRRTVCLFELVHDEKEFWPGSNVGLHIKRTELTERVKFDV